MAHCLLVLLTGLPAAGKSTFVEHLHTSGIDIAASFSLDRFLGSATATEFTPSRWRTASQQLVDAVREELERQVDADDSGPRRIAVILVEDNMHYRSMRYRYWKLCRDVERSRCHTDGFVAILEVRFSAPLDVCLQRNEARRGTPAYIPPVVIETMAALFEDCLDDDDEQTRAAVSAAAFKHWALTPTTQPWTLLTRSGGAEMASAAQLCEEFVHDVLRSAELDSAIEAQRARVLFARLQNAPHEANKATYESAMHVLDQQLRTCVSVYLRSSHARARAEADQRALGRRVHALKKKALAAARQTFGQHGECCEAALETAVMAFQLQLAEIQL